MESIQVDIIGAGISGLNTAISIKNHDSNIKVIVHEKYKEIGYNHEGRRCGEAHTVEQEWITWKPTGKSIYNKISHAHVLIGKKHYSIQVPEGVGFILNKQEFICQLARDAEKCGVVLQTDDKIRSVDDLRGEVIVDGSGCPSTIKRELKIGKGFIGTTYQETLEKSNSFHSNTLEIMYANHIGYFWIFPRNPKKKEVNVGVGVFEKLRYNLREMLQSFKEDNHISGTVNYVVGGLVPLGLQRPFLFRNILFVGDAGVGAFPFTGQGIYRALMSGDIAGRCIAQRKFQRYPSLIREEFLKWDMIGSTFLRMNLVFRKINSALFPTSMNLLFRSGLLDLYSH